MAYGDFKYLTRRTASDKVLRDKVFSIAKSPKYDGYQRGLASMVYKFFDKKSTPQVVVLLIIIIIIISKIGVLWTWLHYNYLKNYINQLLENLKKEKFILDLRIIFAVLI